MKKLKEIFINALCIIGIIALILIAAFGLPMYNYNQCSKMGGDYFYCIMQAFK